MRAFLQKLTAFLRAEPPKWLTRQVFVFIALSLILILILLLRFIPVDSFEQAFCWTVALALIFLAVLFLEKEHASFAFVLCLAAISLFVWRLSGVQALIKTGMLSAVKDTMIKYGEKAEQYQIDLIKMKSDLSNQQEKLNQQEAKLVAADATVRVQQASIDAQYSQTASLATNLTNTQQQLETLAADLSRQQEDLRKANLDVVRQQASLSDQVTKNAALQTALAATQTKLTEQAQNIKDVQSLVEDISANTVIESYSASDAKRVFARPILHPWNTNVSSWSVVQLVRDSHNYGQPHQVFFKLDAIPISGSLEITRHTTSQESALWHVPIAGPVVCQIIGLPQSFKEDTPISVSSTTNNIGIALFTGFNKEGTYIFRYIRDSRRTNLIQNIEIRGTNVFFDGIQVPNPK